MNQQTSFGNMSKFLVIVFFILNLLFIHGSPELLMDPYRYCSDATLSPNSTYFTNLKTLSSALSSNASRKLYHKSSVGRSPNLTAYGDFQCRGDLNATACRKCVATAASNSSQQYCPLSVEAVVWFDECFFRYSNRSFFSIVVEQPSMGLINPDVIEKDVLEFSHVVGSTLNDTVANASSSSARFATKEARFQNETVYALAQCTGDLSKSNCGKCLRDAFRYYPNCCRRNKGARVLFHSCTIRYELYPFYSGVSLSPSSISPPPPKNPSPPSPTAPSLPSSPSTPTPSMAAPPLHSGKLRASLVIGIIYFL